jgi:hypothetical protein
MHKVIIDGIEYVPVSHVTPSPSRILKLAILSSFWGDASDKTDEELDSLCEGITIDVRDDQPFDYGDEPYTIDSFLRDVAWFQTKESSKLP